MPRQFLNPAPVLHDVLGISPAFNGSLTFYEIGTTNLKDTWSDYDQEILNENPVPLDSSARTDTQVWGEGEYTIVLRNEAGEIVWTRDWRPEQAGSEALPPKESGKFLTTDGSQWLLEDILQVPDPTGFSGRILSTDGANLLWVPMPETPEPPDVPIDSGSNYAEFGDTLIQWGTGTAPATGTDFSNDNITFGKSFAEPPPFVAVTVATNNINGTSLVAIGVTGISTGGCTVDFNNADRHYQGSSKLTGPIPYMWMAMGKKP